MKEIWLPIKDYEGLYEISNLGRVKSLHYYGHNNKIGFMTLSLNVDGYPVVTLTNNKNKRSFKIHRLVAQAFIPNIDNKPQVNHKDGNKENNNVDNLEWSTCYENLKHACDQGLRKPRYGGITILTEKEVLEIREKIYS